MASAVSQDGSVKVEWVYIGEGLSGDYDESDSDDVALMRYDSYVSRDAAERFGISVEEGFNEGNWLVPADGSYCTRVPEETSDEKLVELAGRIANELSDALKNGSFKRTAEGLSWIGV